MKKDGRTRNKILIWRGSWGTVLLPQIRRSELRARSSAITPLWHTDVIRRLDLSLFDKFEGAFIYKVTPARMNRSWLGSNFANCVVSYLIFNCMLLWVRPVSLFEIYTTLGKSSNVHVQLMVRTSDMSSNVRILQPLPLLVQYLSYFSNTVHFDQEFYQMT